MEMVQNDEFDEFSISTKKPQKIIKERKIDPEYLLNAKTRELDLAQKNLVKFYANEEKIPVRVAPAYAKYFGRVMRVSINGISVAVKCDGNTVMIPKSFALETLRRMSEMDKYDSRQSRMADISRNLESSPGQLNFFG